MKCTAASILAATVLTGLLVLVAPGGPASAAVSTNTITGRVSVLPGPLEPQFPGDSTAPNVSANGRFVVFTSRARLSPKDSFEFEDVYLRDLLTDEVELISVKPDGTGSVSPSYAGAVTPDGRYVVFNSISNALVPGDTNNVSDVFIRDRQTQTTERVSISSAGQQTTTAAPVNWSFADSMDVSDDGRFVAFTSGSPVFGVTPDSTSNVLVRDRVANTTEMVSVSSTEELPNRGSGELSMSPNGRYVAFSSNAFNIAPDNNQNTRDVFLRDRTLGTTVLVSMPNTGTQSFNASFSPSVSDDGKKVAFLSSGSLTPGDLTSIDDVFVRNLTTSTTTKISVDTGGAEADHHAVDPVISGDGTTVAWQSLSGEYVPGGGNGQIHIFKRVGTNPITRESVSATGALGNGDSVRPRISSDGRTLVYSSASGNLVTGDTGAKDIFVRRRPEVGPHGTTAAYATAITQHFGASGPSVSDRILQGASPEGQVLRLATAPAFATKRAPLVRLYVAYFKRLPDTSGITYWLGQMNAGMTLNQVSAKFATSKEFKTRYGNTTNAEFVVLVYENVLDRAPDAAGLSYWVSRLQAGTSRGTVMTNFSESPEGKRIFRPKVDAVLVSLGLLGEVGPTKLMNAVIDYTRLDSSHRGVQRMVESSEYAAAV